MSESLHERKTQMRAEAFARRKAQPDKDTVSQVILGRLRRLPDSITAKTVLYYIDARSEVRTRQDLPEILQEGEHSVIVPWCNDEGGLELFRLSEMSELELGMYNILEPSPDLRALEEKQVSPAELDLVVVPGVAFDRQGGRLGHGKGYYDKLLENVRPDTKIVALAFESQLFESVPMQPHDIPMDFVITEKTVYHGQGRG